QSKMANAVDHGDALSCFARIDANIVRVLTTVEDRAKDDVIDELLMDFEADQLESCRDILFESCETKLLNECIEKYGPDLGGNKPVLKKVTRRDGKSKLNLVGDDIYGMYVYVSGLSTTFPRNVVTSRSVVPDVTTSQNILDSQKQRPMDAKFLDLQSKLELLHSEMTDLKKEMKSRDAKIEYLCKKVQDLETDSKSRADKIASCEAELDRLNKVIDCSYITIDSIESENGANLQVTSSQNQGLSSNQGDPEKGAKVSSGKNLSAESETPSCKPNQDVNNNNTKQAWPNGKTSRLPLEASSSTNSSSASYADAIKSPPAKGDNDWIMHQSRKSKRRTEQTRRTSTESEQCFNFKRTANARINRSRLFMGMKPVKTIQMYIGNVFCPPESSFAEVMASVNDHLRHNKVRVMNSYIIRNRVSSDTFGIKMTIPDTQRDVMLSESLWPENVTCREWSREPPTRTRRNYGSTPRGGFWRGTSYERTYDRINDNDQRREDVDIAGYSTDDSVNNADNADKDDRMWPGYTSKRWSDWDDC
ncbi:unnamed protein product, partial [Owenia fusiformis]